ncbi:MAG: hypothetical protein K0R05_4419 [Anaerocolumna sp.]|nr:hypothetical protein [Anaerocolumna sp.]
MASKGKRVIASLFGIHLNEDTPQLQSLVPQRISSEIMTGQLPSFSPSTIMLGQNETCHFMDKAALAVKQKEKSYQTHRSGNSYRLTKNYTIHSSNGRTSPVEQEWFEFKEGVVFVTNERIIFVAPEHGFEKKIINLTAFIPYTDAIALQFGSQTINLILPQSQLIAMVLQMVH